MIVALVLSYITVMCLVFLMKSYRASIKIGMDRKVLNKTILSRKKGKNVLENFSLAASMLIAMAGALCLRHYSRYFRIRY